MHLLDWFSKKLVENFNNKRHEIGKTWNKAFSHLKKNELISQWKSQRVQKHLGLGFQLFHKTRKMRDDLREHLERNGIETRPIIFAVMTKQPGIKNIKYRISGKLSGADIIMDRGIFWEVLLI